MNSVIIGTEVATEKPVAVDVDELIKGRLLIQATSGGGKSYLIRKILEVTHGKNVQHIILDMEGDFVTLRESFEYLLAGKGGQIPAEPRSASLLARKVLELNANIIIDLSELSQPDRKKFVRLFLEHLIETPKELWNRQCLVVIDEAHIFCPEKGHGESEATEAINELMSRGRKRGLCGVLATQRPAKLNKDAASQCQNKLVGLASMDVDRKRSASELGFTGKDQEMSLTKIKHQFYAVGPAISSEVILMKAGAVQTKHLEPGKVGHFKAVETEKAQSILAKLADLPHQAEQELKTLADHLRIINEQKAEIYKMRSAAQQTKPTLSTDEIIKLRKRAFDEGRIEAGQEAVILLRKVTETTETLATIADNLKNRINALNVQVTEMYKWADSWANKTPNYNEDLVQKVTVTSPSQTQPPATVTLYNKSGRDIQQYEPVRKEDMSITKPLNAGQKKIVSFLALRPDRFFSKSQLGTMTGYAPNSGTFGTYLSELKTAGWIEQSGQTFRLKAMPPDVEPAPFTSPMQALTDWLNKMGNGGQKRIYEKILEDPAVEWTKEGLATACGFAPESGTYGTYLSNLATLTLIEKVDGKIRLNPELLAV